MRRARGIVVLIGVVALTVLACTESDDAPAATAEPDDGSTTAAAVTTTPTTTGPEPTAPETAATDAPADASATTAPPTTTAQTAAPPMVPATTVPRPVPYDELEIVVYEVPAGARPHDVAPAADGGVWYTAQHRGALGHFDPASGEIRQIPLGSGSRPHGVIVDDDGIAWVTDSGLNAMVSVDPDSEAVTVYPLPENAPDANLNTAAIGGDGRVWFTGQGGYHGVVDPSTGELEVWASPRGPGPYGITATPDGDIYYASLAGDHIAAVAPNGDATVLEPPTPGQGARRVWSDSTGDIWVSEWHSGQLSRYSPATGDWDEWPLPGDQPHAYAVYVDPVDQVWVSDFGGNALHRFDPASERFETFDLPAQPGQVRQIHGRGDEVWGAQSADDSLIVIRPAD